MYNTDLLLWTGSYHASYDLSGSRIPYCHSMFVRPSRYPSLEIVEEINGLRPVSQVVPGGVTFLTAALAVVAPPLKTAIIRS